jgi:HEAT repeat protein
LDVHVPARLRILVFGLLILCEHNVAHSQGSNSQNLQELLTLAKSEAASERLAAAKGLGLSAYPSAATDGLLELLQDKQWFVRGAAADSLKSRGDVSAVTALTHAVQTETNENVRERISAALTGLKSSSGDFFGGFTDPDPAVREKAARRWAYYPISQVTDALVLLLNDPVAAVRTAAAESLVTQRNPAVVTFEIRALETSTDVGVRIRAAAFLGELRVAAAVGPLINALSDPSTRGATVGALSEIGDPRAAQPIVNTLSPTSLSWDESMVALTKLGDAGRAALIGVLSDRDNESARMVAARTLQLCKGPQVIAALAKTLHDPSDMVRGTAAKSLGVIGDRTAVQPLLEALRSERISNIEVASALGKLHDRKAIPALLAELRNSISPQESTAIIGALGDFDDADCLNALIQILQGQYPAKHTFGDLERRYAAELVGSIGGDQADSILFDALRKQDLPVIQGAARYFIAMGRDGSEGPLAKVLDSQDQWLAELYLASGQPLLVAAANSWAAARNVKILPASYKPVKWKQGVLPK